MNPLLGDKIRSRAGNRCEYCRIPHSRYRPPFQIDHIIARQHAGPTDLGNLALACLHCNRFKGPNIAGIDPESGELVRLFHPRTDLWEDHFRFEGARIAAKTAIGRATVQLLAMNASDLLIVRFELMAEEISLG